MSKDKKNDTPQRKKYNETKLYHTDEELRDIEKRIQQGKYKNKQDYYRDLVRKDRLKNER